MEFLSSIHINVWILQVIAMMITAFLIPGFTVSGPLGAILGVVGLAFVNAHVWDVALFLAIPNGLTEQALVTFLANGAIFWVLVKILPGIEVKGIIPTLLAPLVFSITSVGLYHYARDVDWIDLAKRGIAYTEQLRDELRSAPPPEQKPRN